MSEEKSVCQHCLQRYRCPASSASRSACETYEKDDSICQKEIISPKEYYNLRGQFDEVKRDNTKLKTKLCEANKVIREIYEIWAGSDGLIPETAPEAYQERLILQMKNGASMYIKKNGNENSVICQDRGKHSYADGGMDCIICKKRDKKFKLGQEIRNNHK